MSTVQHARKQIKPCLRCNLKIPYIFQACRFVSVLSTIAQAHLNRGTKPETGPAVIHLTRNAMCRRLVLIIHSTLSPFNSLEWSWADAKRDNSSMWELPSLTTVEVNLFASKTPRIHRYFSQRQGTWIERVDDTDGGFWIIFGLDTTIWWRWNYDVTRICTSDTLKRPLQIVKGIWAILWMSILRARF